jgi:ribosomal protein S18 acetylase RimI-like enzyme
MVTVTESALTAATLAEYAAIPITFTVESVLDAGRLVAGSNAEWETRRVERPYTKDYDAIAERPTDWPALWDVSRWRMSIARAEGLPIGGLTLAFDPPNVKMLEGRQDLAVIWDLRVRPERRRRGIATALLARAEEWARAHGAAELKVETQDINVSACSFYSSHGFELRSVRRDACPACPGETQLLWYKRL